MMRHCRKIFNIWSTLFALGGDAFKLFFCGLFQLRLLFC